MRLILLMGLGAGLLFGETRGDWANVKALAVGQEIRTSMQDGKSYRGEVQSVSDHSLIMVAASTQQTLARTQVMKVSSKGKGHRLRNTLIGLGAGAGLGLGIGATQDCSNCLGPRNLGKAVFGTLGAVVGTIAGVAWPTGGWHDVYKAK